MGILRKTQIPRSFYLKCCATAWPWNKDLTVSTIQGNLSIPVEIFLVPCYVLEKVMLFKETILQVGCVWLRILSSESNVKWSAWTRTSEVVWRVITQEDLLVKRLQVIGWNSSEVLSMNLHSGDYLDDDESCKRLFMSAQEVHLKYILKFWKVLHHVFLTGKGRRNFLLLRRLTNWRTELRNRESPSWWRVKL